MNGILSNRFANYKLRISGVVALLFFYILTSAYQPISKSAHYHIAILAHQPISTSTHQHISTSPHQHILFQDNFNYPSGPLPSKYWSEGCTAVIKDGHLFVDADTTGYRQSTIWLDQELSGDLIIECDVRVISSDKKVNNINFMLFYSDPQGRNLRDSRSERSDGVYNRYHRLSGYIFTYLADGTENNARFRFRDNPGFNLINEARGFECKIGKTYHIKIIKKGNRFQFWSNGYKAIDARDDRFNPLYDKGYFGFRTWHTTLWWDNLTIRQGIQNDYK